MRISKAQSPPRLVIYQGCLPDDVPARAAADSPCAAWWAPAASRHPALSTPGRTIHNGFRVDRLRRLPVLPLAGTGVHPQLITSWIISGMMNSVVIWLVHVRRGVIISTTICVSFEVGFGIMGSRSVPAARR